MVSDDLRYSQHIVFRKTICSSMMKILTIVGARPQFVKAAAFSRKLRELTDWNEVIVHTGQHFDANMSDVFFKEMEIPEPQYRLEINSMDRMPMIEKMQLRIEEVIDTEKPDLVLVYGDTNSTLAGAKAAKAKEVKLAHVEAGLRSYNLDMPEEHNRVETDALSDILFVPSENAIANLEKEGIGENHQIHNVGDIMYDAVLYYSGKLKDRDAANLHSHSQYVLLTLHRAENTDNDEVLAKLVKIVNEVAKRLPVVLPVHPRTRKKLESLLIPINATVIDPVGYFDMLRLIKGSHLVMTDSGGLQKEAFYLNKYCITLRTETEWTELVELGVNKICGSDLSLAMEAFEEFMHLPFPKSESPYGNGDTAERIIQVLQEH